LAYAERPVAATVLSLIGGILSIVGSLVLVGYASLLIFIPGVVSLVVIGGWILLCASLIIISALMLYSRPDQHSTWGIIILIASIIGGLNIFGIIGGALALAWKPAFVRPYSYYTYGSITVCPNCKKILTHDTAVCPHCQTRIK